MKVTEQIDALEANAVDAFKYLAVTRIIALMIAMPLLTIMMDFAGMLGGYGGDRGVRHVLAAVLRARLQLHLLLGHHPRHAEDHRVRLSHCRRVQLSRFHDEPRHEGVGEASTRSVVMASVLIILSDVILVKLIFFFYPVVSG